jgi:hypothetical protein
LSATPACPQHDKLRAIVHQDVSDLAAIEDRLSGYDACFFCLGVSAVFAAHCGVDVRSMAHRDALGLPVDEVRAYEIGRRCYFALNDLRGWKQNNVHRKTSLFSLFQAWSKSFSTPFHWNDPMPALAYFGQTIVDFFRPGLKPTPAEAGVLEPINASPADSSPTSGAPSVGAASAK